MSTHKISLFKESEITESDIGFWSGKKKRHQCSSTFVSLCPTCHVKTRVFTVLPHCKKILLKTFLVKVEGCDLFLRFFSASFFIRGFNRRLSSSCCKRFVWITLCGFWYHGWLIWWHVLCLWFSGAKLLKLIFLQLRHFFSVMFSFLLPEN